MSVSTRGLAAWADAVEQQERACPWPGPRPLDAKDLDSDDATKGRRLVGRDSDVKRLCQRLESDFLIVLHGESGVGKSSFLEVGLKRGLPGANFQGYPITEWTQWKPPARETEDDLDLFADYLKDRFTAQFGHLMSPTRAAELAELGVTEFLCRFPGRPVLVLDQFEEFLRVASWDGLEWFKSWLVAVNRAHTLRIVISLRSEFLYKLDNVLKEVRQFSLSVLSLESISDPASISEIITHPASWAEIDIAEPVLELLVRSFGESANIRDSFWLLRLQSILYSLYWYCEGDPTGVTISTERFASWLTEWAADSRRRTDLPHALVAFAQRTGQDDDAPVVGLDTRSECTRVAEALTEAGFLRAVDLKLEHCEAEATKAGALPSQVMNPLARDQLRRTLPFLSTGSYKERQDLLQLFRSTYQDELERLMAGGRPHDASKPEGSVTNREHLVRGCGELTEQTLSDLFEGLWRLTQDDQAEHDLLSVPRSALIEATDAHRFDVHSGWVAAIEQERQWLQVDYVPWWEDENHSGSGAMLGARPLEVVAEMLRGFLFASLWLEKSLICRIAGTQIRLTHDGFGPALLDWAKPARRPAETEISSFVAMVGELRIWGEEIEAFGAGEDERTRYLINLRWQSCQFRNASFKHVVFLNCDFRNTRFEECRFEGVIFANCQLDGSILSRCTIIGGASLDAMADTIPLTDPEWPDADGPRQQVTEKGGIPSFVVEHPSADAMAVLDHLRGRFPLEESLSRASSSPLLYSPTSGVGAMVVERRPRGVGAIPELASGLVVLGSRISGFMVRQTGFEGVTEAGQFGLVFAYVAGSSIDLVEQDELSLGVTGCALRGLSVSRPLVDSSQPGALVVGEDAFTVQVQDSLLVNTWFGDLLRGAVTVTTSTLYGLASMPHHQDLKISLDELVGAALVDNASTVACRALELGGVQGWERKDGANERLWRIDGLAEVSRKTDYRDRGARSELERRAKVLSATGQPRKARK